MDPSERNNHSTASEQQQSLQQIPEDAQVLEQPIWRRVTSSSSGNNNNIIISNGGIRGGPTAGGSERTIERNASLTMEDVALLMREQDADLLESIHIKEANSAGTTPVTTSLFAPSSLAVDMPALNLDDDELLTAPCTPDQASSSQRSRSSSRSQAEVVSCLIEAECFIRETSLARRALSGEIWIQNNDETEEEDTALSTSNPSGENSETLTRADNTERRLNEAAQFAEAVGDITGTARETLRIIDEEEEDPAHDSDDDGTPEVRVVRSVPVPAHAIMEQRSRSPKIRPQWPFKTVRGFLDQLPDSACSQDFVYKGIRSNPPQIVKRGIDRGNYAQLHRKAWLEVSDKYHRYGKNLRLYYRYWERLGCPTNMFFDWLDSKGEAAGQTLPEMEECPRAQLDSDTVLYISDPEVTDGYALKFIPVDGVGKCIDVDGDFVSTGQEGWIFVLRDNVLYGAQKITSVSGNSKQRFHHSSFFGGKAVAAAGIFITNDEGILLRLYPHSGHYRPGEAHMQRMLFFLYHEGVDLQSFEMDTQQILHVARESDLVKKGGETEQTEKKKKVESLHLLPAGHVACFLAHKARFIGEGIFSQIHRIRKAGARSVTEALSIIDDGGSW